MCGIAGFIDFNSVADKPILVTMTDRLSHRGPDASGYFFEQKEKFTLGLGHRRLSIIDLSPSGSQPMEFLNGRYRIVFNGEIYNYAELRESLIKLGHKFVSNSDTEIILHSYHEWGADAITHFVGMFAFVIYDSEEEVLFCSRDRVGVKPFFYYWDGGAFLFGSELKSIVSNPVFKKEINGNAVASFMQFGYVPAPHCIYRNTYKLLPGHTMRVNLRTRELHSEMYWNVYDCYNKEKVDISIDEAVMETERVLSRAFMYRMVADVPVGVFLSGGYDSSCLVSLLQTNLSERLKTFTIGFEDSKLNEAEYAKEIAGILGTDHHEYYCSEADALSVIPDLPFYYDEPFADSSAIPTILVSRMARRSVTVALSADAGDEIFGGYDRYEWMMRIAGRINSIPEIFRKSGAGILNSIPIDEFPWIRNNHIFLKRYEKLAVILKDPSPLNLFMGMTVDFSEKERKKLIRERTAPVYSAHLVEELRPEHFDLLTYAMAKDYQTYLSDDILQKVDRATMSVGLEGREPFLDQGIIEWVGGLPREYKIYGGERKYILRQIVHKYLPEELMRRPKMGFSVPVRHWLTGILRPLVDMYLDRSFIERQNLFNVEYIEQVKKSYYKLNKENDYKIWYLLMFQMWYDKWMNGN